MWRADFGIVGLGVMGRNLALNLAGQGTTVALTDPWPDALGDFKATTRPLHDDLRAADDLSQLVSMLARPRSILLMVKAGEPVDRQIDELAPLLDRGDLVIDGGNSHYRDSERRAAALAARGLLFLAAGISGGAAGARDGASIMVGGARDGFLRVERLLDGLAAKVDGEPCCAYFGPGGAGHFVKMVHNGIEYADMQLIGEAFLILQDLLGLDYREMSDVFSEWNRGELESYLIEITARILATDDRESGRPLVEMILDRAGQKGTGQWTSVAALELGVPAPTIAAAVAARALSALKDQRVVAATRLSGPRQAGPAGDVTSFVADLGRALLAARICAYAQGFAILRAGAEAFDWPLDLRAVARIWRGGCIIRAALLAPIGEAYGADPGLRTLLLAPALRDTLARCQGTWRGVVARAVEAGLPVPAMSSALGYYDALRRPQLWANLTQAQRDYFGAHGYERTDRPGTFHGDWQTR